MPNPWKIYFCVVCKNAFTRQTRSGVTCSDVCAKILIHERCTLAQAGRKRKEKSCPVCGKFHTRQAASCEDKECIHTMRQRAAHKPMPKKTLEAIRLTTEGNRKHYAVLRQKRITANPLPLCACGCGGQIIRRKRNGMPHKFLTNHTQNGRKMTEASKAKRKESLRIIRETIGIKHNPVESSKGLKRAWDRSSSGFKKFRWTVVSPTGIRYITTNLRRWCQENQRLFHDRFPHSKTPVWLRAQIGITKLANERYCCSWHGWTLAQYVPLKPLKGTPGPDLLGRDEAAMLL